MFFRLRAVKTAILVVAALFAMASMHASANDYADELVARALALEIQKRREWQVLLHYQKRILGVQPMRPLVRTPAAADLEWEDVSLRAADGTALFAWFLPVKAGKPRGTILFLHGNAENISTHLGSVWWLPARGYQVLLLDYLDDTLGS